MDYYVGCIPQETTNTCWAAAMAMLLQYLSGNSRPPASLGSSPFATAFTPRQVAERVGGVILWAYDQNRMLSTDFRDNFDQLARPWKLHPQFNFNNQSSSEWVRLLRRFGPYFVLDSRIYFDHALIVCGINQDQLTIVDPWPVGRGSWYTISRRELRPTGTVIHADSDTEVVLQPTRGGGS